MALIQWNDDLVLGIAQIDREHRAWVTILNELDDAMLQGKGNEAVGQTLSQLISYTQYHFGSEESLFEAHGYQESLAHKLEHADFVERIGELSAAFARGKTSLLSVDVASFLSGWLRAHIMISDRRYVGLLRAQGVR